MAKFTHFDGFCDNCGGSNDYSTIHAGRGLCRCDKTSKQEPAQDPVPTTKQCELLLKELGHWIWYQRDYGDGGEFIFDQRKIDAVKIWYKSLQVSNG